MNIKHLVESCATLFMRSVQFRELNEAVHSLPEDTKLDEIAAMVSQASLSFFMDFGMTLADNYLFDMNVVPNDKMGNVFCVTFLLYHEQSTVVASATFILKLSIVDDNFAKSYVLTPVYG